MKLASSRHSFPSALSLRSESPRPMTQSRWMLAVVFALAVCLCDPLRAELFQRLPLEPPEPFPAERQDSSRRLELQENQNTGPLASLEPAASAVPLTYALSDFEGLALALNPAMQESLSRIEAAKGRAMQASLPPNPSIGYLGNEIGNEGSPGQHGAFWRRQFVRGGKLELSHAVACREVQRLHQEYYILRERILTDVRTAFYELVLLQRRMELLNRILETNIRATKIAQRLFEVGENTKNDVLLLELEAEQTSTDIIAIEAMRLAKWRSMSRLVGQTELESGPLQEPTKAFEIAWEEALALMQQSPQLASVNAEIARNRATLARASAESIPNLNAQVSFQYDFATSDTFAGVQLGMPIPKLNRNQGAIYEANANVRAALQKAERTRLAIERNLADKYGVYDQAKRQLQQIDSVIVPKAEEVVRIALGAYEAGEASLADVLNAQRSLLRSLLRQLDAKQQRRLSYVAMRGFLLSDGLTTNQ